MNSGLKVMSEEEVQEFHKKNPNVKLINDEEINDLIKRAEDLNEESSGFKETYKDEKSDLLIQTKPGPAGTLETRSFIGFKDRKPKELFEFICDFKFSLESDTMVSKMFFLKRLTETQSVMVYETKPLVKFVVWARDFVYLTERKELENGTCVICNRSIVFDEYPDQKGIVRAWNHGLIWYMKPHPKNENDTLLIHMAAADGKGWIPEWFARFITNKFAPKFAKSLSLKVVEHQEWKKKNEEKKE